MVRRPAGFSFVGVMLLAHAIDGAGMDHIAEHYIEEAKLSQSGGLGQITKVEKGIDTTSISLTSVCPLGLGDILESASVSYMHHIRGAPLLSRTTSVSTPKGTFLLYRILGAAELSLYKAVPRRLTQIFIKHESSIESTLTS